jgi:hypothetical protein
MRRYEGVLPLGSLSVEPHEVSVLVSCRLTRLRVFVYLISFAWLNYHLNFDAFMMVDSIETLCRKMTLTEGEKVGITISEDETADLCLKSGRYLIGRLMSDRRIPKEAFWTQMSQLWKILDCVAFKEIHDNLWLIEFSNENNKNRDKEGLLWLFNRTVFVLKEVEDSIPPTQMDFTQSLFWVQVHNMPVICMNREVGHRIRATMGMVEEVDVTRDGVGWDAACSFGSTLI